MTIKKRGEVLWQGRCLKKRGRECISLKKKLFATFVRFQFPFFGVQQFQVGDLASLNFQIWRSCLPKMRFTFCVCARVFQVPPNRLPLPLRSREKNFRSNNFLGFSHKNDFFLLLPYWEVTGRCCCHYIAFNFCNDRVRRASDAWSSSRFARRWAPCTIWVRCLLLVLFFAR